MEMTNITAYLPLLHSPCTLCADRRAGEAVPAAGPGGAAGGRDEPGERGHAEADQHALRRLHRLLRRPGRAGAPVPRRHRHEGPQSEVAVLPDHPHRGLPVHPQGK